MERKMERKKEEGRSHKGWNGAKPAAKGAPMAKKGEVKHVREGHKKEGEKEHARAGRKGGRSESHKEHVKAGRSAGKKVEHKGGEKHVHIHHHHHGRGEK